MVPQTVAHAYGAVRTEGQRILRASKRGPAALVPCILLFSAAALIVVFTFKDYGITWDEHWHSTYGELVIAWYTSMFQDSRALDLWLLKYYGGLFDVIANSIDRFSPLGHYETRHLVSAACGLLGALGAYRIGSYLHGRAAGFLAALMLLLTPVYWGHSFNNPKDIPFAAFFTLALYYLVRGIGELPRVRWRTALLFGITTGASLGVRIGGLLLFGYAAVALMVWGWQQRRLAPGVIRSSWRPIAARMVVAGATAYSIMLLFWPAAQVSPLLHPARSLLKATDIGGPKAVLFEGEEMLTASLPWYYLPKWMLLTLPEFVLVGLAMVAIAAVATLLSHTLHVRPLVLAIEHGMLGFAVIFPVVFTAITRPVLYDGLRHFIFLLPAMAVLAAIGWIRMLRLMPRYRMKAPVLIALIGMLALTLVDMVQLHPHQYVYFNRVFAGGLARAAGSYETDYWGNSYREGALWVAQNYSPAQGQKLRVTSCSYPLSTRYFLPTDRFSYIPNVAADADLFLATTRNNCHQQLSGQVVHIVKRQGVALLYVKALTPGAYRN